MGLLDSMLASYLLTIVVLRKLGLITGRDYTLQRY